NSQLHCPIKDSSRFIRLEKVRLTTASHGRINFVAAKQKQITDKVASRTRRRGQELMHLIDLDVAAFDIFDLPPLNEYELYIKNFGRSDTRQEYVQCNEDNLEKEIQTEEIETRTKWTQNPASDAAGFGDDEDDLQEDLSSLTEKANIDSLRLSKFLQRATQVSCNEDNLEKEIQTEEIETRTKWTQNPASDAAGFGDDEDDLQEDLSSLTEKANIDSLRLSKFLQRATQTCLILLEENISEQANTQFKDRNDMTCSDGFIQLSTKQPYLEGRPVICVHISPVQTYFLLVAYGPVKEQGKVTSKIDSNIQDKGLVCFWNTNEPSGPQKILICESSPRCCCLSPSKATLAFAGLEDGSLVAWDLRESSMMPSFSRVSFGDSEIILRPPTFSTAGVLKKDESHLSPVVSLLPIVMPGDRHMLQEISAATSFDLFITIHNTYEIMLYDMLGLSFQLASLEENAAIYLWVVVELDRANTAGSESDLGLSPGGKIKLIKSSSISLQSPYRDFRSKMSLQALIMRFLPHDPNHIYVGTDGGYVLHCERHGSRAPPKAHRPAIGK
ncbi:WD repeat-containing protein 60-like, partial [Orbicella faveolata]|uniref:WD repeat-containing protein 60-like n=1 Tax=Orbicella faveolata TaxID=48498 RepID=UPI0009E35603